MSLETYFKEKGPVIEAALKNTLESNSYIPDNLRSSMLYSLMAGGKRLRPLLCLAACEACGGDHQLAMAPAVALEMIHTFSLIHDDLPAMDNDDLRRGKPTNHKVYGDAMAILAGDGISLFAFEVLIQLGAKIPAPRLVALVAEIAKASGPTGMVGGQVLDMEAEGKKINLDHLRQLHHKKTACLIMASLVCGALTVTDDKKSIENLRSFGNQIGLAFQIADDILDIEGGEEIGKDLKSDLKKGKMTYPALMGLTEAKKEGRLVLDSALKSLDSFGSKAHLLREMAYFVIERKK